MLGPNAHLLNLIPRPLPQIPSQQAVTYFFTEYTNPQRQIELSRGYLTYVLPLYNHSSSDSPLTVVVQALALVAFSSLPGRQNLRITARQTYGAAIGKMKAVIQDPVESLTNETLAAVMLFGLYESLACTRETMLAWSSHIDGAIALIKRRGPLAFEDPIFQRLCFSIRTQMIINCITRCRPLESGSGGPDWTLVSEACAADIINKLVVRMMNIPRLRVIALQIMSWDKNETNADEILQLMRDTIDCDNDLVKWPSELPLGWTSSIQGFYEGFVEDPQSSESYPGYIDKYGDIWIANAWNMYRTARIFTRAITLNCIEWLNQTPWSIVAHDPSESITCLRTLVDEICASVPWMIRAGTDGIPSAPSPNELVSPAAQLGSRTALGGYLLIWPLFTAKGVSCIPEAQVQWIRGRLLHIGETFGINQATLLAYVDTPYNEYQVGFMRTVTDFTLPTVLVTPDEVISRLPTFEYE